MRTLLFSLLLLTVALFSCSSLYSQTIPSKQWDVRFGGSGDDSLTAICATPDGGVLSAGFTGSNGGFDVSENSRGGSDYWIVKTNAQGNKQWDKRFGGSSNDVLNAIEATSDGGFILGGYSFSGIGAEHSQNNRGKCDYWVIKINGDGDKQWDARFGGNNFDYLFSLKQTTDGGYLLAGYSDSEISGDMTGESRGANDYWIVKTDANGDKEWDARFGGGSDDNLSCIIQTPDGGYLLGGLTHSKLDDGGDITVGVKGGKDYWIVKTDAGGLKEWDGRYGGKDRDIMHDVISTPDGGYLLTGLSASQPSGDVTEAQRGAEDYWVVKIDANGFIQWNKRFGGPDMDICTSVLPTVDGNYLLAGLSRSNAGGDKSQNGRGIDDYWLVKMSSTGTKLWDVRFGASSSDVLFQVCRAADGGFVLGGLSRSGMNGDKTQNSRGGSDYWILKLNPELITWYRDADVDGFGNTSMDSLSVFQPQGYVASGNDCNDGNALISPSTLEACNGIDDNCNLIIDENAVPVTVSPGGPITSCLSASITFTASGNNLISYQWFRDGIAVNGATESSYASKTGNSFYVVVSSSAGCSGQSATVTVVRNNNPPSKITVGGNGNVDLCNGTVVLKIPFAELRTWQWYKDNEIIAGATGAEYHPTSAGFYKILSTNTTTQCSKMSTPLQVFKSCKMSGDLSVSGLELFPNPAKDVVTISWNQAISDAPVTLQIFNELGQMVYEENIMVENGMITIALDASFTADKMYLVRMKAGDEVYEGKFAVER